MDPPSFRPERGVAEFDPPETGVPAHASSIRLTIGVITARTGSIPAISIMISKGTCPVKPVPARSMARVVPLRHPALLPMRRRCHKCFRLWTAGRHAGLEDPGPFDGSGCGPACLRSSSGEVGSSTTPPGCEQRHLAPPRRFAAGLSDPMKAASGDHGWDQ
jgi:hypothetical protein